MHVLYITLNKTFELESSSVSNSYCLVQSPFSISYIDPTRFVHEILVGRRCRPKTMRYGHACE